MALTGSAKQYYYGNNTQMNKLFEDRSESSVHYAMRRSRRNKKRNRKGRSESLVKVNDPNHKTTNANSQLDSKSEVNMSKVSVDKDVNNVKIETPINKTFKGNHSKVNKNNRKRKRKIKDDAQAAENKKQKVDSKNKNAEDCIHEDSFCSVASHSRYPDKNFLKELLGVILEKAEEICPALDVSFKIKSDKVNSIVDFIENNDESKVVHFKASSGKVKGRRYVDIPNDLDPQEVQKFFGAEAIALWQHKKKMKRYILKFKSEEDIEKIDDKGYSLNNSPKIYVKSIFTAIKKSKRFDSSKDNEIVESADEDEKEIIDAINEVDKDESIDAGVTVDVGKTVETGEKGDEDQASETVKVNESSNDPEVVVEGDSSIDGGGGEGKDEAKCDDKEINDETDSEVKSDSKEGKDAAVKE